MIKRVSAAVLAATVGTTLTFAAAQAQVTFTTPNDEAARAPRALRERGPALAPAIVAAQGAVDACADMGYQVSVAVVDFAGLPVVLLSGDGAAAITQSIAMGKAVSALRNGRPSAELVEAIKTDKALAAKIAADPQQGVQRGGGLPIKTGATTIGALAVSGAPDAGWDAVCANAGLAKAMPARPAGRR